MSTEAPLIIQYTNLLHKYGNPDAPAVRDFVQANQADQVFVRRVDVLNKVFKGEPNVSIPPVTDPPRPTPRNPSPSALSRMDDGLCGSDEPAKTGAASNSERRNGLGEAEGNPLLAPVKKLLERLGVTAAGSLVVSWWRGGEEILQELRDGVAAVEGEETP